MTIQASVSKAATRLGIDLSKKLERGDVQRLKTELQSEHPSISAAHYEVGPEFVERFVAADAGNDAYFAPSGKPGHAMFDLNRYTVDRLTRAGVQADMLGRCTYAEEDLFYSYRRTTHRKEADYGRQISAIVLEE